MDLHMKLFASRPLTRVLLAVLLTVAPASGAGAAIRPPERPEVALPAARGAELAASYGRMPISFEANVGQFETDAKFLSRGDGYALLLGSDGMALALAGPGAPGAAREAAVMR